MYSSIHQFQGCTTDFSTFPVPMLFWICMPICNVQLEGNLFCLNLSSKGRHLYHNVSPLTFDKDLSVYCTLDSKSLCSSTCYIGQNVCCVSDLIAFYDTNIFALKKTMLELGFKMHTFNWNAFLHLYNCGHPWTMHLIFMWVKSSGWKASMLCMWSSNTLNSCSQFLIQFSFFWVLLPWDAWYGWGWFRKSG